MPRNLFGFGQSTNAARSARNHNNLPISTTAFHEISNVACIKEERKVLLEFKHDLIDPLSVLDSWLGEDCYRWNGIVCNNQTDNVIELLLSHKQISGKLSMSIGSLSHNLETLNLSINSISGALQTSIGNLSPLTFLVLDLQSTSNINRKSVTFGDLGPFQQHSPRSTSDIN
ncbi:receptor-like protein 43 [Rosa rugosa]|uniref:receptor-like protein 43 n=1 Tax=Rosa rugosa TaxID=74645 RepID=UPI002B40AEBA|nr:receptor-like protein 43 [Rosa rugosa]